MNPKPVLDHSRRHADRAADAPPASARAGSGGARRRSARLGPAADTDVGPGAAGSTGAGSGVEPDLIVDAVLSASRVLVAVAARSLAGLAEEVTLTQYRTLVVLAAQGPSAIISLAEALAVTPPTASRLCERLVRKGLVRRRTDPHDRRQVRVTLTPTGRRLVDEVTERRRGEIADLLRMVPADARRSVVEGLQLLSEAAGEVPEQDWTTGWDL